MTEVKKPKFYRRNKLINPNLQLTIMGYFIGLTFVTLVFFYLTFRVVIVRFIEDARAINGLTEANILQLAQTQYRMLNSTCLELGLVLLIVLCSGGLVLSHRVAGPIYRMRMHIQDAIKTGDISKDLSFRKKDYFHELATEYNELLAKLRERFFK